MLLEFQELQNTAASEGQVVVLECRVRGAPPLRVQWFRQGSEIQDSPDFRILQKSKERCPLSRVSVGFSVVSREIKGAVLYFQSRMSLDSPRCAGSELM